MVVRTMLVWHTSGASILVPTFERLHPMQGRRVDGSLISFLLISAVVIAAPGPDTALTIRNIVAGGRPAGIATALGVTSGQFLWAFATSAGIASILITSKPVFSAVKLTGALYLIYLGVRALHSASRDRSSVLPNTQATSSTHLSPMAAFGQGLISNLANPKMPVFFASILPQFVPGARAEFSMVFALGLVFCSMTFLWLSMYSFLIATFHGVFARPRFARALEGTMGAVLVALGARVALAKN